jgi:hypothetical protein
MGSFLCVPSDKKTIMVLEKATEVNTEANRISLIETDNFVTSGVSLCIDIDKPFQTG